MISLIFRGMGSDGVLYERPCAMGKAELTAKLKYRSTSYLFRKIHANRELMCELCAVGYKVSDRFLSKRMVELIYERMGYPEINN